jgi:hypothetical protein
MRSSWEGLGVSKPSHAKVVFGGLGGCLATGVMVILCLLLSAASLGLSVFVVIWVLRWMEVIQ